jgi:hypothetical protein
MSYLAGVWKDLIVSASALPGGATAPALTTLTGNIKQYAYKTGDLAYGSFEIQHDYKEGTDLSVHLHIAPTTTNVGNFSFTFEYSIGQVGSVFTAAATLTASGTTPGVANTAALITFTPVITGTALKVGDIISFTLTRLAAGNTFTGDVFVTNIGIHYQCDSLGSNQISSKN